MFMISLQADQSPSPRPGLVCAKSGLAPRLTALGDWGPEFLVKESWESSSHSRLTSPGLGALRSSASALCILRLDDWFVCRPICCTARSIEHRASAINHQHANRTA